MGNIWRIGVIGAARNFLLSGVTLGLTWCSGVFSLTQITGNTDANLALRFSPGDPTALANRANAEIISQPLRPELWRGLDVLALRSLRAQALNPRALRLLAFVARDEARHLARTNFARLAIKSSRRETGALIFMIDDRVKHDDVVGALKYYDLAMRTSLAARVQLLPVLTNAIEDDEVRKALVPIIKTQPNWIYDFFEYAITNSDNPKTLAKLIEQTGGWPGDPKFDWLTNRLLSQMIAKFQFADFRTHYLTLKNARPFLLTSPVISASSFSDGPGILAWQKLGSSSVGMDYVEEQSRQGAMHLYAGSGDRQVVARKILFLNHGSYKFTATLGSLEVTTGAGLQWSIACLTRDSTLVWSVEQTQLKSNSTLRQTFEIPPNCEAQALDIGVSGGQNQQGAEVLVTSITLSKASGPN